MWLCKSDQPSEKHQKIVRTLVWVLLLASWIPAGCFSISETFSPPNRLDPREVSHKLFHDILQGMVRDGWFDYPAVRSDPRLAAYLAQLDRVDPTTLDAPQDRLAFWINAYNACAIKGVLDGESPAPYIGWYRYFKVSKYAIGGAKLNLYDLEHEILRKQFKEPRVHFAIVCASVSCPKLQPWAYAGAALDHQLDDVTRSFINDSSRNRFDRQKRIAYVSKIFDWFEEDFIASAGSVPQFLSRYVENEELARELAAGLYRIEYLEYDWSLNGIRP